MTHWSVDDNSFKCSALIEAVLLSLYVVGGSVLRRELGGMVSSMIIFGQYEFVNYLFSLLFMVATQQINRTTLLLLACLTKHLWVLLSDIMSLNV